MKSSNKNYDDKLIRNLMDEIQRLKNQLQELEDYKDELGEDEITSIKNDTLEQLVNNTKILEKMQAGDITTTSLVDEAKKVIFFKYKINI